MRSNGAVHIRNDTFVAVTRDCNSHIFLVTSAFPNEERVAPLRLTRRTRITPNSSLSYNATGVERFTESYRKYSEERVKEAHANMTAPLKVSSKVPFPHSVQEERVRGSVEADHRAIALKPPPLELGKSTQEVMDSTEDTDWALFLRHSLHVSPDAHRIAAMSNTCHRHYIINIGEPTDIFPFETSETVRSVCWHPEQTHLLLLLLVSGVFVVYDTTALSFRSSSRPVYQVFLKSLIRSVLDREASGSLPNKSKTKSASRMGTSQSSHIALVEEAAALRTREGEAALVSYNSPRSSAKAHKVSMLIDELGMPTKGPDKGAASTWAKPMSNSRVGILRDVQEAHRSGRSTLQRPFSMLPGAASRTEDPSHRSTHTVKLIEGAAAGGRDATSSRAASLSPTIPPKEEGGVERTRAASTVSPAPSLPSALREVALHENSVMGLATTREDPPGSSEASALELVDMCCVRPTRGLPTTLLLLCRGGDVFTVKLDGLGALATGAAVPRDGRLPLSAQEAKAVRQRDGEWVRMPDIHHLLPSRAHFGAGEDTEEALALTCFCIDEDAGTHVLLVCLSSGVLRGVYVDEPDLIARDRASSAAPRPPDGRASFQLHLSPAVEVRGLVSPATAPTTTHSVQLMTVGNVCLLRYGLDEAFVVAIPVWSRARGGWSYYCPPCGHPQRREAEAGRLCLGGVTSEVPPPLAVRVPYDVAEASLALGDTELLLVPEMKEKGSTCLREHIIAVKVASLLQSALYAQAGDLRCCFDPGLPPGESKPHSDAKTSSADEKALAKETSVNELEGLLNNVAKCHRQWLCGFPPDEVDISTARLAEGTERAITVCKREEQLLEVREAKLHARLEALGERVSQGMARLNAWTDTLLDVIVHRRGARSIVAANERLGEIHKMLCEYENGKSTFAHINA
ncbi:unnamed protein product [Phytomonas sp. EM1]|nr:unnamed protein product [Phytomonas sp. EM1]|eukprot:CCW62632.1 unnamed protein product [Phytomonas sp. isolate EM1]